MENTYWLPGSDEKIEILKIRLENDEPLWNQNDAKMTDYIRESYAEELNKLENKFPLEAIEKLRKKALTIVSLKYKNEWTNIIY